MIEASNDALITGWQLGWMVNAWPFSFYFKENWAHSLGHFIQINYYLHQYANQCTQALSLKHPIWMCIWSKNIHWQAWHNTIWPVPQYHYPQNVCSYCVFQVGVVHNDKFLKIGQPEYFEPTQVWLRFKPLMS